MPDNIEREIEYPDLTDVADMPLSLCVLAAYQQPQPSSEEFAQHLYLLVFADYASSFCVHEFEVPDFPNSIYYGRLNELEAAGYVRDETFIPVKIAGQGRYLRYMIERDKTSPATIPLHALPYRNVALQKS